MEYQVAESLCEFFEDKYGSYGRDGTQKNQKDFCKNGINGKNTKFIPMPQPPSKNGQISQESLENYIILWGKEKSRRKTSSHRK